VSFSVGEDKGKAFPGLYKRESHDVVPVADCLLVSKKSNEIAHEGFVLAGAHGSKKHGRLFLKNIIVRSGFFTGETMVSFVTQSEALPEGRSVAEELSARFAEIAGVVNVIESEDDRKQPESSLLFGKPTIRESLGKIQFSLSADSFFQVNSRQAEVLYQEAISLVQPARGERVFDAYCGVGGFALFFAPLVAETLGVERDKEAVRNAAENARLNGFANVRFIAADLEKKGNLANKDFKGFTTLVVDPPRRGLPQELIHQFASSSFEKILYASCDPATLARDCRLFQEHGFHLKEVVPVDMFPETSHLECLALLVRS
jgi:23S rRNA (uracil1939-C5)-methyltransferase